MERTDVVERGPGFDFPSVGHTSRSQLGTKPSSVALARSLRSAMQRAACGLRLAYRVRAPPDSSHTPDSPSHLASVGGGIV